MITRDQVNSYRMALEEVSTTALGDLRELMDGLTGLDADIARDVLFQAVPTLFDPYAVTASNLSATFYEETRALAGSPTQYTPRALAEPVPLESWTSLVGFGTDGLEFDASGADEAYSRISGGLVKRLTRTAAETVDMNGSEDPDRVSYQRVPAPGCCGFCGMLASRGAIYGSRDEAGKVVGRGTPINKTRNADGTRKSGGQAKGVKTRGTQKAGEDFHDDCKCIVVAVFAGNAVEMAADADKYLTAYGDAYDKIDDGLELRATEYDVGGGMTKNRYEWVDAEGRAWSAKERERAIAQAMNKDSDVLDAIAAEAWPNRPPAHADLFEHATPAPSKGPSLTFENVADLTDDELAEAMATVFADDPEAWDKLETIMDRREAERWANDAPPVVLEPYVDPYVDPFGTKLDGGAEALASPTKDKARKLTPNEKVAEEYWEYAQGQYLTAMDDLNGVFFNHKFRELAREKGISEDTLFSGPFHVANKYASDELREWWRINGRETQTSYRYMALGRPSDRKAWEAVQKQGLHSSGIRGARRENRRGL